MYGLQGSAVLLSVIVVLFSASEAAKILGILPSAGWSHYAIGEGIMKALSRAGHEVTVVGAHHWKQAPSSYRTIVLEELKFDKAGAEPDLFQYRNDHNLNVLYLLYTTIGPGLSEIILTHPNVKELLKSNESFDAVIVESFASEALYGFAQHFNAPLITFSPFGASMWANELVGTPYPYSQIPHTFLSYTDRMTFGERFINAFVWNVDSFYYRNFFLPGQEIMYKKYFPNATMPLRQVMKNTSLVFLNQHFSLSFPHPYAPNMIEVGGIQISEPKKLPEDIQTFINNSKHGVIYFSMGSMLKGCNFPEDKRNAFIEAFSKLKENILWKYENTSLPNKPKNVLVKQWLAQNDILAHPNVKLFITHGGLLGSTEALYHGKPMLGIPIYGDQRMNMARAEKAGYGAHLEYETLNAESIYQSIRAILDDASYTENARSISERYRDKPMSPSQTVVYWVEYVIRHRGAPQLRSSAVDLSYFEYNLFDVYGSFVLLVVLFLGSFIYMLRNVPLLFGRSPNTKNSNNKKSD
ncbi:UDP-glycosyltransferase UGT5-like [Malaya genurostris]|uniref:UDP-glycosyltransferase UGT5-like n=1 Tax=Malaya genurostris TaxID=325434 RepID=UPI0026F3D163|nr:UDP-glycosyltransferase UGT5-like [Malaya genurostris]XP_058460621.1 UDP-glycosyltransferase UGT5-like [Malaya genurostris]XP_058460622.1 UDP-glycosyltransferase UGT5-like [Malaya genurostris]XP_058460624.1 UDP-glycosyltransferase UGT5-like [Malaya genurostris]XP_058460625.1 UDP-glycosyltransferase UGT5-like [Malaya genurostris]